MHAGFWSIDTTCKPKYYNDAGVGFGWVDAAKDMGLWREDLFIQTKSNSFDSQYSNDVHFIKNDPIETQKL